MNQLSLFNEHPFSNENIKQDVKAIHISNGEYIYVINFYTNLEADYLLTSLNDTIEWRQDSVSMYGKKVLFPRLTAWYGDLDKKYTFSGITLHPKPWTVNLLEIKHKIEKLFGMQFNSVLLNKYRDGKDSISWHTDAEKELGTNPIIASVNFGATRKFQLRHNTTKEKIEIKLSHGSLLIMKGELQHYWQHQVPKTKQECKERINLTFRMIQ